MANFSSGDRVELRGRRLVARAATKVHEGQWAALLDIDGTVAGGVLEATFVAGGDTGLLEVVIHDVVVACVVEGVAGAVEGLDQRVREGLAFWKRLLSLLN